MVRSIQKIDSCCKWVMVELAMYDPCVHNTSNCTVLNSGVHLVGVVHAS